MASNDLTAFIFARGGSKGIKNKNIKPLAGKPLISYAIDCAFNSKYISRVIVSTDSERIADVAGKYGAEVLMRPKELAQDETPEIEAWRHALGAMQEQRVFISLPATAPLRTPEDIDAAVERFEKGDCDIVFGISPSHRNPYLNMVTIGDDDLVHIAIQGSDAVRRQDVPEVFDITTCVYVTGSDYVMNCERLIDGRVGYVKIPAERSLDIDEEYDLYLAELMLKHPFKGIVQE